MKDDVIYRQQAIDTMCKSCSDWCDEGVCKKVTAIQNLPSAQPNVHDYAKDADSISRQALCEYALNQKDKSVTPNEIMRFPSSQSEALTDNEQRIFLAAMSREEKVCKQVDDEFRGCREAYEDSLVRICREITRKVKGALWT